MACPLCYTPVLAGVFSALGLNYDTRFGYGATGAGGVAMLGASWLRRGGCPTRRWLWRTNALGGGMLLLWGICGFSNFVAKDQLRPGGDTCHSQSTQTAKARPEK